MTVELASAYVSIIPTAKGIQAGLEKELAPLSGVAEKAGTDSGKALGSGFTKGGGLKAGASKAADDLGGLPSVGSEAGAATGKALGSSFSGASGGLKSVLGDAEGAFTGFKGKATSALDAIGVSSTLLKVAGGAAIAGFAVNAISDFTNMAKSALDLSTSTGLAVEDASRWIGVGDDYKVGADALATGLGKVTKSLDDAKWKNYGIATHDAGGKARDVNDILLDTFDKLSSITNATEQARVGQELFGKGYQSLTPILGHTRDEYEKMLGSVEKGQVITASEAASAEKMRLAQDALSDALKEVSLQAGAALAKLSPLLVALAKFVNLAFDFFSPGGGAGGGKFSQVEDALDSLGTQIKRSRLDVDYWRDEVNSGRETLDQVVTTLHKYDDVTTNAQTSTLGYSYALADATRMANEANDAVRDSTNSTLGYSYAVYDVQQAVEAEARAVDENKRANKSMSDDVQRGLDEIKDSWDRLTGSISDDKTWVNLQTDFIGLKDKFEEANKAMVDGTADATQKALDYRGAVDDQKLAVIDYGRTVLGLPEDRLTNILTLIDKGSLDAAQAALNNLTRNYTVNMSIVGHGGAGYSGDKTFAAGGYTPGGWVLVGEKGPEWVDLPGGSYVHPASDTRSLMSGSTSSSMATVVAPPRSGRPLVIQLMAGNKLLEEIYVSGKQMQGAVS